MRPSGVLGLFRKSPSEEELEETIQQHIEEAQRQTAENIWGAVALLFGLDRIALDHKLKCRVQSLDEKARDSRNCAEAAGQLAIDDYRKTILAAAAEFRRIAAEARAVRDQQLDEVKALLQAAGEAEDAANRLFGLVNLLDPGPADEIESGEGEDEEE
jgi:hypothetical protein